jgi:hypothetical protein
MAGKTANVFQSEMVLLNVRAVAISIALNHNRAHAVLVVV